jgi:hypothetical protein
MTHHQTVQDALQSVLTRLATADTWRCRVVPICEPGPPYALVRVEAKPHAFDVGVNSDTGMVTLYSPGRCDVVIGHVGLHTAGWENLIPHLLYGAPKQFASQLRSAP